MGLPFTVLSVGFQESSEQGRTGDQAASKVWAVWKALRMWFSLDQLQCIAGNFKHRSCENLTMWVPTGTAKVAP